MMFADPNGFAAEPGRKAWLNARIVDPAQGLDSQGGLLVEDGAIVGSGPDVTAQSVGSDTDSHDCTGAVLIPGLIDMRVHTGEPGGENRETIASASRAAAAGGVTSMVMMPDTSPAIDDVALVEFALRTARETAITRLLPSAAITKGFDGETMTEFGLLKEAGAVALSHANTTLMHSGVLRRSMTYARDFDMLYGHCSRDPGLAGNGVMNEGLFASWLGLPGIPREAELLPLERDIRLARLTGVRYHAEKISAEMSAQAIRRAKDDGLPVSAAATINHLSLNENDIGEYRTFFKLSPPLRHEDDRQAMISALNDGTIDVIVSAHNPQDVDAKRLPFAEAADGAIGLETMLAAGLRLVHGGQASLMTLVKAMSTRPAQLLGLETGTLMAGKPADFALVDFERPWIVDPSDLQSKSKNTAFEDARMTGKVIETVVAGRSIYRA